MITAFFSGMTAVIVTLLVNIFTVRRERESDWRKLKLDRYQEFIAALSEVTNSQSIAEREHRERYANAVNSLTLVASDSALGAIYRFQDETSPAENKLLLKAFIDEIRKDISPKTKPTGLVYRFFDPSIEQ